MLLLVAGLVMAVHQKPQEVELSPQWRRAFEQRMNFLIKRNGTGTDPALAARLVKMADEDQKVRMVMTQQPQSKWSKSFVDAMAVTDRRLTAELKDIVAKNGWPAIRLVGYQASDDAALILVHSADHKFQKRWIPKLQKLADNDEIVGSSIALMIDKVLVAEKKPQRFGSQFDIKGGKAIQFPTEDPKHLDERRAKYMLPPMDEYKKMLNKMYNVTE